MAGLHGPLPTLRPWPRGQTRTARGRRGSLLLRRIGLSPTTPGRSPGALPNLTANDPTRRGRPRAALDVAPPGRLGARAVRAGVLSRDDPRGPAPPQAVVEESQEAAGTGRPGAKAGLHRAAPGRAGRRSTRPASRGLSRRGAHPPGRGSRLWLGRARPAFMGCLKLAGPVGAGLVRRAVPLQRRPGAAVALSAGQWRPHDRGAATPAGRVPR